MEWNWKISGSWEYRYYAAVPSSLEQRLLLSSGEILGAVNHVGPSERDQLRIYSLSDEAIKTSAIKGEMLDRHCVQSSLRLQLGFSIDRYASNSRITQ
jgi:hypothetical protein